MLLAFVIVGFTNKFEENLGPFNIGLLSSWAVAGGVSTVDVCMVGTVGIPESVCVVGALSMVAPTEKEKG